MKLSVYSGRRRRSRKRMKGHKRNCRCAIHRGRHKRRSTSRRTSRRTTHRRGHRHSRRSSGSRKLGAAARSASRICRSLQRRGKINKLRACFRREMKFALARRSRR